MTSLTSDGSCERTEISVLKVAFSAADASSKYAI